MYASGGAEWGLQRVRSNTYRAACRAFCLGRERLLARRASGGVSLACRNPKVTPRLVSTTDAWGDGGAGAGAGADVAAAKASKRTLKRDSHDTLMLLTPFMLWSTLVFIFYAVSVAHLRVRLGRRGCRAHGPHRCSCVAWPSTLQPLPIFPSRCALHRARVSPSSSVRCPMMSQDVGPLVAMASVSNYNTARTYRTCFYAQVGLGHVGRRAGI